MPILMQRARVKRLRAVLKQTFYLQHRPGACLPGYTGAAAGKGYSAEEGEAGSGPGPKAVDGEGQAPSSVRFIVVRFA